MRRIRSIHLGIIFSVAIIVSFSACSKYPQNVADALNKAKDNRPELEKVINHFKDSGDSLMLEAAYYLIGNMEGHSYTVIAYYDTSGNEVPIRRQRLSGFQIDAGLPGYGGGGTGRYRLR